MKTKLSLSNQEKILLKSKNPVEFINLSVKYKEKIKWGRKAVICRKWLKNNLKYTVKDIQYARHRHPYWKKQKCKGNTKRSKLRNLRYINTYTKIKSKWSLKDIKEFIKITKKYKDYELAIYFNRTIYSIQFMRRKYWYAVRICKAKNIKLTMKNILQYIVIDEKLLRNKFLKGKF